jgi:hypothetical protein
MLPMQQAEIARAALGTLLTGALDGPLGNCQKSGGRRLFSVVEAIHME